MLPLLAAALLAGTTPSVSALRSVPEPGTMLFVASSGEAACDDGSAGGTLVQRADDWYGNRFAAPCTAALLHSVRFAHFGYGLPGPYAFRLHLLDASCTEKGVTPILEIEGAPDDVTTVEIDLADLGWCVESAFHLLLEPLSCTGPTQDDCFPALVVDGTADGDGSSHCAIVSAPAATGRACFAARSADGRYFDFALRAQLDCASPQCATAVSPSTWGGLKRLFAR